MVSKVSGFFPVVRVALLTLGFALVTGAAGQVGVTTYHNDNARSGLNNHEPYLNPSNVNSTTFGLLFTLPVDGYVFAQPLYLPRLTIPSKGTHNVLFVATEHNSVYAFDADNDAGANSKPLWHVNLGPSVPNWDTGTDDINPEVGITGTPVIVPGSNNEPATLFVVAKTKTINVNGMSVYTQKLHALSVTTGAEKTGSPVVIKAQVNGRGEGTDGEGHVPFNSLIQNNRAALLFVNASGSASTGTIYIPFASHGDNGPYHGWLLGYDAVSLKQVSVLNTTPNALSDPSGPIAAGGIWQGGAGVASDGTNLFCATGNGTFDPTTGAYGDSVIRILPSHSNLIVGDYFAPSDQQSLDDYDGDLGSGGVLLLPAEVGSATAPNLLVMSGKEGTVYLLNRQNLGKFHSSNTVVEELPSVIGGIWGMPAYFNQNIYFGPVGGSLAQFKIAGGQFIGTGPINYGPDSFGYPGTVPSVSSDGINNGIVWAVETDGYSGGGNTNVGPASLRAYSANNVSTELYNSANTQGRDLLPIPAKFAAPTVVNGKVYVGTSASVGVFGLGKWTATPVVTPASGNYSNHVTVSITDPTPGAKIYYTTDGSTPTTASTLYTEPTVISQCATFSARAFAPGEGPSSQTLNYYQINAVIGSGNGLNGSYFANTEDPTTGTPTATRIDPTINFNWNGGSPISGVGDSNWSCEWTGHILAECTATYTFTTYSDDGVRVNVNGQWIIQDWTDHAPTYDSGTITLQAGQSYTIKVDYYQDGGGSLCQLFWSSLGMPMQIVPQTQLSSP